MDTSETYIKMCEKAKEIQGIEHPLTTVIDMTKFIYRENNVFYLEMSKNDYKVIWLPRQDQLQEMVIGKWLGMAITYDIHEGYSYKLYNAGYEKALGVFETMEQLWLVFVMKEKYNKVWDGEEWIT